ncbi:PREDICTED: probable arabinosyltransferase ARAD2 isoform X2 [Camelina sativa]|uniref:Probable arabinosyltransferase ARAD2 isoform X2 n=1 Tax=Camelina sativa TaxID=90675 RepID=A0ABM0X0K3_CAMSA|nr:PREDICTED: probable arabinosyltransferase ARAD2 isoform X2 [Camelina sativa]
MVPKITSMASTRPLCSIPYLLLSFSLLFVFSLLFFFSNSLLSNPNPRFSHITLQNGINVFVAKLPRSLNYGLLENYWSSSSPDSRIPTDPDHPTRKTHLPKTDAYPPYPENPLIKQYSAEYWIMGDLETPPEKRIGSFAKRVFSESDADVVFVPFFATLSAEMELGNGKGSFRKKSGNEDYQRQRQVLDFVKNTEAWKRSNGRDHVFVLTDPVAMWHVREEIALSILLVVDFGGWFRQDSKSSNGTSLPERIEHTQVSVIKDVIVPYTHLLPRLDLSQNLRRHSLLYFKGAKHRHRGGLIREKLWDLLVDEQGVVMEEGFPNATGREQSIRGMRNSEFCLHPAGDTPTSCRLFDAIQSLCIPVIVSDTIELPFEGMIDYSEFSVFVSANGIGPIEPDGAVNHIWKKVQQKMPMVKEAVMRERRKPAGAASVPLRCQCI